MSGRRLLRLRLLQLRRGRRVARRIAKRNRLRNRDRTLTVAHCSRGRPALVIRTVNVWSDEEQDLAVLSCRQFPLEEITYDRERSETRCTLLRFAFCVGKHAAHDSRAAIGNEHLRLHALRVDTGNAGHCDTCVQRVVLNRHSQKNCSRISDLWCDRKTKRNRNECSGNNGCSTRGLCGLHRNLRTTFNLSGSIVQSRHAWSRNRLGLALRLGCRYQQTDLSGAKQSGRKSDDRVWVCGSKSAVRLKRTHKPGGWITERIERCRRRTGRCRACTAGSARSSRSAGGCIRLRNSTDRAELTIDAHDCG